VAIKAHLWCTPKLCNSLLQVPAETRSIPEFRKQLEKFLGEKNFIGIYQIQRYKYLICLRDILSYRV